MHELIGPSKYAKTLTLLWDLSSSHPLQLSEDVFTVASSLKSQGFGLRLTIKSKGPPTTHHP